MKQLYTPTKDAYFRNDINGHPEINLGPLQTTKYTTLAPSIEGRQNFISKAINNEVYYYGPVMARPCEDLSVFPGPRGSITAFNFEIAPELTTTSYGVRSFKYSTYGQIDQYVTNATDKYDIIDIPVTVEGVNSMRMISLPIRIIRYAGT